MEIKLRRREAAERLRNWWWRRQRATDMAILWPECQMQTATIDKARELFMVHASSDPAWARFYGDDLWKAVCELK